MHSAECGNDHAPVCCKLEFTPVKLYQTRPKPLPLVDVSTFDSLRNQRFQQLLSSKLDNTTLPTDPTRPCSQRSVRLKERVRNSRFAHIEIQAVKRTV